MSHPVYVRHSLHYIYDIIPTMYDITTLCVNYTKLGIVMTYFALKKMSHPLYHTKLQSLWLHIYFRHDITPPVSDTHQLYLCHHNCSTDITPAFVWHHTHYMCDIICTIYNIISTAYVITLLYLWQHKLAIETTSSMQFKIYTIPVTSQSHVCVISPTVLRASHPIFVWHHTQHRYSIICTIEDITSSLMKSNHHFYDITPTVFDIVLTLFLSPHPLYWWYHTNSIYEISSSTYVDIISVAYNNISTIFVSSQPLYLCLTPTISMISHPLYIWHSSHYMFNIRYTI